MANGVSSEWTDIQVKMGNYLPYPHIETMNEKMDKILEVE